jgi:hypothetical protein
VKWLKEHRPDVLLTVVGKTKDWLDQMGLVPPRDIGLAHISLGPYEQGWSGVYPQPEELAAAAVDLLSAHLVRNESGRPECSKVVLVKGVWVPGTTTCARKPVRKKSAG